MCEELRSCRICGEAKPLDGFYLHRYRTVDGTIGREYRTKVCKACRSIRDRARYDATHHRKRISIKVRSDGQVWCKQCADYLPPERFKRHPHQPSGYATYCITCQRAIWKRGHMRRTATAEAWRKHLDYHNAQSRHQRRPGLDERREFCLKGVQSLRRKGLNWDAISAITGLAFQTMNDWKTSRTRWPTEAAEARIALALKAAVDLPFLATVPRIMRTDPEVVELLRQRVHDEWQALPRTRGYGRWRQARDREAAA